MTQEEVFPNPLVKRVIFQIKFPNLFFLQNRIGDFQIEIMKDFPASQLLIQRQFPIARIADSEKHDESSNEVTPPEEIQRIWRFVSDTGVKLDVTLDALTLVSDSHKSYNTGPAPRFRDTIDLACESFLAIAPVPVVNRIGLRYMNECPVPENRDEPFLAYYNSTFPLKRFPLDDSLDMSSTVTVNRTPHTLRYIEAIQGEGENRKLVLDFDAWSEDIESSQIMQVTDALHEIILKEFRETIREPVLEHMRLQPEVGNDK